MARGCDYPSKDTSGGRESRHLEILGTFNRKLSIAPRLVPNERTMEAVLRIVDAVHQLRHLRQKPASAFEIDRAYHHVAARAGMTEEISHGCGKNHAVVLGDDVVDHGKVRRIVEHDAFLAIVDVEIVRHHVLPQHQAIAEPLHRHIVQHLIVVLVTRKKLLPSGMTHKQCLRFATLPKSMELDFQEDMESLKNGQSFTTWIWRILWDVLRDWTNCIGNYSHGNLL